VPATRTSSQAEAVTGVRTGYLAGDTPVLTSQGLTPMRRIRVGDHVQTHLGTTAAVAETHHRGPGEPLLNVRVAYDDHIDPRRPGVTLSGGHEVWANTDPDTAPPAEGMRWVRADDLREGHLVALPRVQGPWVDRATIDLADYADSEATVTDEEIVEWHVSPYGGHRVEKRVRRHVSVDEDFCTLFGMLTVQPGALHSAGVCTATKSAAALATKVWGFGDEAARSPLRDRRYSRAVRAFYAAAWSTERTDAFGLPHWMLRLPEPKRRALLTGLWPAAASGPWRNLHTYSKRLSGHVQSLLLSLGLPASRGKVPARVAVQVGGVWQVRTTPKFAPLDPRHGFSDDRFVYLRVRDVLPCSAEEGFGLTLVGGQSYVTSSLVVRGGVE
jgi:hypothetical protein